MSTGLLRRTYTGRGWVPGAAGAAMLIMIVFAAPLHAAQSLVLKSGESRTYTIPNKAPFTGLGDFRIEMRIHDFAGCDTTYANIWNFGAVLFRCHTAGSNMMQFLDPAAGAGCNLPFTGTSDMLVRFQRTLNGHMFCAIWSIEGQQISTYKSDAGTRSPTAIARSQLQVGGPGITVNIAWARWFSTVVPDDGPAPMNDAGGDLADWEFEGNSRDASANNMNLSGGTYTASRTYAPTIVVKVVQDGETNDENVVRAGHCFTLDSSSSSSLGPTASLTREWQPISGPTQLRFPSGRTGVKVDACDAVFGDYVLRLRIEDESKRASVKDFHVGAVATDDQGVVVYSDPKLDYMFGPIIRYGKNPWKFADTNQRNMLNALGARLDTDPDFESQWRNYLAGTVSTTAGSTAVTGTDTTFASDFCNIQGSVSLTAGSPVVTGSHTYFQGLFCTAASGWTQGRDDSKLVVYYPDGAAAAYKVAGCASNEKITLAPEEVDAVRDVSEARVGRMLNGTIEPAVNAHMVLYNESGSKFPVSVGSCQSQTELTLQGTDDRITTRTWPQYAKTDGNVPINFGWAWNGIGGQNNANYYDDVLAYYNMYYRSGLAKYRDYARALASRWADSPWFGDGPYPRMWALNGIIFSTWEANIPSRWPAIESVLARWNGTITKPGQVDNVREEAYMVAYNVNAAMFEPDKQKAETYKQVVITSKENRWKNSRSPQGYIQGDACNWAICNAYDQLDFSAQVTKGSRHATVMPEAGTVSIANGSNVVTGMGTDFQRRLCRGGTHPAHTGTARESVVLWTGTDYIPASVNSCDSATQVTLDNPYGGPDLMNVQWSLSWPYWDQQDKWWNGPTIKLTNESRTAVFSENLDGRDLACGNTTIPTFYSALMIRTRPAANTHIGLVEVSSCETRNSITLKDPWTGPTGDYQFGQPGTNIWFEEDGYNTEGYQAMFLDPVTAILDKPYERDTGLRRWRFGGGKYTQPFMQGLALSAWNWAYKLTNDDEMKSWVIDTTKWIAKEGYWPDVKGLYYFRGGPGCDAFPSYYLYCMGGGRGPGDLSAVRSARYYGGEVLNAFSQAYLLSKDDDIKTVGETLYSACLGRPGSGGNLDNEYCRELEAHEDGTKAKDAGFFYGMGNSPSWPAARLGGAQPAQERPVPISFDMASVPNASQVRVTLLKPDGTTVQKTCSTSPCVVRVDARLGDHLIRREYLSGTGAVLTSSEMQTVAVK